MQYKRLIQIIKEEVDEVLDEENWGLGDPGTNARPWEDAERKKAKAAAAAKAVTRVDSPIGVARIKKPAPATGPTRAVSKVPSKPWPTPPGATPQQVAAARADASEPSLPKTQKLTAIERGGKSAKVAARAPQSGPRYKSPAGTKAPPKHVRGSKKPRNPKWAKTAKNRKF